MDFPADRYNGDIKPGNARFRAFMPQGRTCVSAPAFPYLYKCALGRPAIQPSFSIMISRMVRSVSAMPGALTRPMLRMASSGVAPQMPSVG